MMTVTLNLSRNDSFQTPHTKENEMSERYSEFNFCEVTRLYARF